MKRGENSSGVPATVSGLPVHPVRFYQAVRHFPHKSAGESLMTLGRLSVRSWIHAQGDRLPPDEVLQADIWPILNTHFELPSPFSPLFFNAMYDKIEK